jgi:cytochrome oxidase assembly protein ShyY1
MRFTICLTPRTLLERGFIDSYRKAPLPRERPSEQGGRTRVTATLARSDPNVPTLSPAKHPDTILKRIHAGISQG